MSLGYAVVVRTAAAFHLPESWVYPFGSLLAFPTSHEGRILASAPLSTWLTSVCACACACACVCVCVCVCVSVCLCVCVPYGAVVCAAISNR